MSFRASGSSIVIVGASLAGAKAAETLRQEGFTGRITLVGDEPHRPYERPPLSKGYLQGTSERAAVFVHPAGWYDEHAVGLRVGTEAVAVDRAAREVLLAGGERVPYDKLLLTTGSTVRTLTVPGADLGGVHYLRRIEDSDDLLAAFTRGGRVAIIGGGWIGLETAAAARAAGLEVTLLEHGTLPLLRVLGAELAQVFADLHRGHGVHLHSEVKVSELTGEGGSVTGVGLGDGTVVDADIVVVGVGILPNDVLARNARLDVENGITVDEHLRTSDPDVYAAGDVANAYHPVLRRQVRVEHWANARRQGATAARAMLGQDVVYDRLPYFFSDQYDLGMEYTGYVGPEGYDRVVLRGDPASGQFIAFWITDDRVAAGMNVNTWDVAGDIERLILSRRPIDPDRLADDGIPFDEV